MKLIGGFQANKIGSLALDVVPRGGVIWSPATRWNVKALYGQAFRAPSINETSLNHPGLQGDPQPAAGERRDLRPRVELPRRPGSGQRELLPQPAHRQHRRRLERAGVALRESGRGDVPGRGTRRQVLRQSQPATCWARSCIRPIEDGEGATNITPVPNTSAKGGISFQNERGITASVFDNYQGSINGFSSILNPLPSSRHLLSAHARLDFAALLKSRADRRCGARDQRRQPDQRAGVAAGLGQQHRRHHPGASRPHASTSASRCPSDDG